MCQLSLPRYVLEDSLIGRLLPCSGKDIETRIIAPAYESSYTTESLDDNYAETTNFESFHH